MKIKKLHLIDYKRFHDLTIDLGDNPKRIVALVGPNGCGKSSVFDAMLFHVNAYGRIGSTGGKDFTYHSLKHEANYNFRKISILFDQGDYSSVRTMKQENGLEQTIFSFRSAFRFNGNLHIGESRAIPELRLNHAGASYASAIDQRMEENYRRLNVKYNNYLNEEDCKPSEAKKHIIGELNESLT